jgi:iron complex transport system permease protein
LAAATVLSLIMGQDAVSLSDVVDGLGGGEASRDGLVVRHIRLPRTLLAIAAGAALGLAGGVMQGLTRNPLADPGIMGVNAGAALGGVSAIILASHTEFTTYVWWCLVGAAVAGLLVYLVGSRGTGLASLRLVLAGMACSAVLGGLTALLTFTDVTQFARFRFWNVGTLAGRGGAVVVQTVSFVVLGAVLAACVSRYLNILGVGEEHARATGANPAAARGVGFIAVVLLCGATTAAVGPIAFVGLAVPHLARRAVGTDYRWLLPATGIIGAILLVTADVIGRLIAAPGELQVSIVVAMMGGPILIYLIPAVGRGRSAP